MGKRRSPSVPFFLLANVTAAMALSPFLILYRQALLIIPVQVWLLLLATGVFQSVYFAGLAGAYRRGDMSLAYPLARAVPVLLVAGLNLTLGKGDQIGKLAATGMLLVSAGCLILPMPRFRHFRWASYWNATCLLALVAALGTTGYTMIDDAALRQLRGLGPSPLNNIETTLLFITLEAISISLVLGAFLLLQPAQRSLLSEVWRKNRYYAAVTGVIIAATYSLVLLAMAYVSNVSYVAAFRQFSIPLGAILGMTVQGEPRFLPKIAGIAVIFFGLLLVGLG
jgi:drug/metabolite transporter (DMT)-like permease